MNRRSCQLDRAVLPLVALLTLALVWVIKDSIKEPRVEPGQKAPLFSFKTDGGPEIRNKEFGGKILVLNFWASWCTPCVAEMPTLNRLAANLRDDGLVVAAVSVDRNEESYRRFLQRLKPAFLTSRDSTSEIPYSFGTFQIPETYIIDRSGRVRRKYIAFQNWADPTITNEIRSLLHE